MVPEDLWAVLTGQQPMPRQAPLPRPAPRYEEEEPDEEAEVSEPFSYDMRGPVEGAGIEEQSAERYTPAPHPVVVSMETLPLPPRERHAAFHQRIDQPVVAIVEQSPSPAASVRALLTSTDLKRAVILQEILGPPKGMRRD